MSIHDELCACFQSYDPQVFKDLHHEKFIMVRELDLSTRDGHCKIINKLAVIPDWNWHIKAEVVHENVFCMEWRWRDRDETVTNVGLKKDCKLWRSTISRTLFTTHPTQAFIDSFLYFLLPAKLKRRNEDAFTHCSHFAF
jgi:hypothetical protein